MFNCLFYLMLLDLYETVKQLFLHMLYMYTCYIQYKYIYLHVLYIQFVYTVKYAFLTYEW